jgi:hypothetical protein
MFDMLVSNFILTYTIKKVEEEEEEEKEKKKQK